MGIEHTFQMLRNVFVGDRTSRRCLQKALRDHS
jgi:hypothetical protein